MELRDELMTLLTAGHETTATGLSWAFERLLRTPHVLERLTESLDDDDYVDAVVKETLRVRPVIVDVARKLTRDTEVAGWQLPAGTLVLPAIAVLHARPDLYESPEEFRPERFVDGGAESYAWIPFGGGVRRCIGASFAQVEMRTVLREVLKRVRLRAPSQRPERGVIRHVTVVPGRGCRVDSRRATSRRAGGGTRRRPQRWPRHRGRAGRGRASEVTTDRSAGSGSDSTSAAMSSSAAFGPRREANCTVTPGPPSSSNGLPSSTTVTGSPLRSANAVELLDQLAHRAGSVTPPARRPRADHVHAVDQPSHRRRLMNSTIAPMSSRPAAACAASATPVPSSSVALRIAPNMIDAPKKSTSVQSTVSRSTGRTIPPASLDRRD